MGEKLNRFLEGCGRVCDWIVAFVTGAVFAIFLGLLIALALTCCSGCSTGEVTAGANISCLAFSIKPEIHFDGINFGLPIITNVTCTCSNSNSNSNSLPSQALPTARTDGDPQPPAES